VQWISDTSGNTGDNTTAQMVAWINEGNWAYVTDTDGVSPVPVRVVNADPPHLRTQADGKYTNNLLALPHF